MKAIIALVLCALMLTVTASSLRSKSFQHPTIEGREEHWRIQTTDEKLLETKVTWRVYLKLRNTAELAALSYAVADPTSPQYGQMVTLDFIRERFNPTQSQVDRTLSWIQSANGIAKHEILEIPEGREYIRLRSSVADLQELFNTQFGYFKSLVSRSEE